MKTTDLIPLILYQLADGDKYGYEIVKQIEDSSDGAIVLKQPTLYSLLKKLEQGKFISSYWQDSDIGGKRHYYKLTDNGKAQLDTYPAFEQLIADIAGENNFENTLQSPSVDNVNIENQKDNAASEVKDIEPITMSESEQTQIDDNKNVYLSSINVESNNIDLPREDIIKPITIDLTSPTPMVEAEFKTASEPVTVEIDTNSSIDDSNIVQNNSASSYINIFDAMQPAENDFYKDSAESLINNEEEHKEVPLVKDLKESDISENNTISLDEDENVHPVVETGKNEFANHVKPVEMATAPNKLYSKLSPNDELLQPIMKEEVGSPTANQIEQIKYLDHIDLSTDKAAVKRKKAITRRVQKMVVTCLSLLVVFVSTLILNSKYSFSGLYYIFAALTCCVMVFYPIILLRNVPKIRLRYCSAPFGYSVSRDFFIKLSLFLTFAILILAYNISIVSNIKNIFALANCANFIAPLLLCSVIMLDFVYSVLIFKKYRK